MSKPCPISASQFNASAKPMSLNIAGGALVADPRTFSTGSFGWFAGGKVPAIVDGQNVMVQVGVTLTVIGSKDAPR